MRSCQALPFLKIWLEAQHPPPPPLPAEKGGGAYYVSAITKNVIVCTVLANKKYLVLDCSLLIKYCVILTLFSLAYSKYYTILHKIATVLN